MNTRKLDLEAKNLEKSANALYSYLCEIKRYSSRSDFNKEALRDEIVRLRNQRFSMLSIHGIKPTDNEIEGWNELVKSLMEDK